PRALHSFPTRRSSDLEPCCEPGWLGMPTVRLLRTPQLCEYLVSRLDIAEGHQELAQRVIVQCIRLVRIAVRDHDRAVAPHGGIRSEEHTSELQSLTNL